MDVIIKKDSHIQYEAEANGLNFILPIEELSRYHSSEENSPYLLYRNMNPGYVELDPITSRGNLNGSMAPEHSGQSPGSKTGIGKGRIDPHEIEMSKIYIHDIVLAKQIFQIPIIGATGNKDIEVAILDTSCSPRFIVAMRKINPDILIENVSNFTSTETAHGDAVVISFLEELHKIGFSDFKKLKIKIYDVSEVIGLNHYISLFHVLNALNHIGSNHQNVNFINMSFLFNTEAEWLKDEMNNFPGKITCAVGNNNRAIQASQDHPYQPYPSTYDNAQKFFPVIGHGNDPTMIWQSKNGPGSNYPFDINDQRYFAGQAVFDFRQLGNLNLESLKYDGGTSFAAPRVMAQLVAKENGVGSFSLNDINLYESKNRIVKASVYNYS